MRVCSYNMGSGPQDLHNLLEYNGVKRTPQDIQNKMTFPRICGLDGTPIPHYCSQERYDRVESAAAKTIHQAADVFLMQEVGILKRPLVEMVKLRDPGFYEIKHRSKRLDNMILLSRARFHQIKNHSQKIVIMARTQMTSEFSKDVAIATAFDKQNKHRVAFVSLHVPGFNLSATGETLTNEAAKGDTYCKKVLDEVDKIKGVSQFIIGGDFNANPEKWERRFQIFKEGGFRIVRTGAPTNVFARNGVKDARELDFFLIRDNALTTSNAEAEHLKGFDFRSHEQNSSDHAPIVLKVGGVARRTLQTQRGQPRGEGQFTATSGRNDFSLRQRDLTPQMPPKRQSNHHPSNMDRSIGSQGLRKAPRLLFLKTMFIRLLNWASRFFSSLRALSFGIGR